MRYLLEHRYPHVTLLINLAPPIRGFVGEFATCRALVTGRAETAL